MDLNPASMFVPRTNSPTPVDQKLQKPTDQRMQDYPARISSNIPVNKNSQKQPSLKDRVKELEEDVKVKDAALEALKMELESLKNEKSMSMQVLEIRNKDLETRLIALKDKIEGTGNEVELKQSLLILETEHAAESNLIADLESVTKKLESENKKLEDRLKFETQISAQLRESIIKTSEQLNSYIPDLEKVVKPTANDLEQTLEELKPLIAEIENLKVRINTTRDAAETTQEMINKRYSTVTVSMLQDALRDNDPVYSKLCKEYFELIPQGEKALKLLDEQIKLATHAPIPLEHVKRMSAVNYLQMDIIDLNERKFAKLLAKSQATSTELLTALEHIDRRFNDAARHLNYIDHTIGKMTKTDTWAIFAVNHWGDKLRISPTSPSFEKELVG
jgi:DNA repair exonuclease SbcCD ATPase subunit